MEFILIKENEDGSADYNLHLTSDETSDIVRTVIMKALLLAAQEGSNYDPSKANVGDATSGGEDSVHGSGEQSSKPEQPGDGFKTSQVLG
jgi:hypothetical protein